MTDAKNNKLPQTPVWVFVYWSESGGFKDNELIPFPEFESRCNRIALTHGKDQGYLKTKYKVLFANGGEYTGRIDLAENDDRSFRHSLDRQAAYYRSKEVEARSNESCLQNYKNEFLPFYDAIVW